MMLIRCPHCGPRAQIEFDYGGDASVARPDPESTGTAQWLDHVYLRDNPCGPHVEWWQHSAGCRAWIRVRRDTATHAVLGTSTADGEPPGGGS